LKRGNEHSKIKPITVHAFGSQITIITKIFSNTNVKPIHTTNIVVQKNTATEQEMDDKYKRTGI
jgi:hypothetical protein